MQNLKLVDALERYVKDVFVPSFEGISHNYKEYTSLECLEAGANVLLNALLELSIKQ